MPKIFSALHLLASLVHPQQMVTLLCFMYTESSIMVSNTVSVVEQVQSCWIRLTQVPPVLD